MRQSGPDWRWAWLSGVIALAIMLPVLWQGLGVDHGIFSYSAWIWRKFGQPPYLFCFDQAFPGIFLIHYFVQAVMGESVTAFRVFDLAWQVASAIMLYLVVASTFQNRGAGLLAAVLYSFFYVKLGPWDTGQRDGFFPLLYLLSFVLLKPLSGKRTGLLAPALAGLLIGFALLIKPVAGAIALVLVALALVSAQRKWLAAFLFCLGCALPSLAIIAYYLHAGALKELYQVLFVFNAKVYAGSMKIPAGEAWRGILLVKLWPHNWAILLDAALLPVLWSRLRVPDKSRAFWLAALFAATYLGYFFQARYFYYHQAPVWGLLSGFAGAGWVLTLEFLLSKTRLSGRTKKAALASLLVLAAASMLSGDYLRLLKTTFTRPPAEGQSSFDYFRVCGRAASYIRARTSASDTVQVWGGEALVNYLAKRRSPSRFAQTFPLILMSGDSPKTALQQELEREFLESLRRSPPAYFVIETMSHPWFGIKSDKDRLVADYPELWKFITEKYNWENGIGFMELYRLSN